MFNFKAVYIIVNCYSPASRAARGRGFLHLLDPVLAPGVRHVNQQNKLNKNK